MTTDVSSSLPVTAAAPAQYLTFVLGSEVFAIGILAIKEIIEYRAPTAVPMMPGCVRGVINLRGAVVPVLDPLVRFGRAPSVVGKRSCIVIVEAGQERDRQVVGIVVDAVNAVREIAPEDIEPPPAFGAGLRAEFVLGMADVEGGFVVVLDLVQLVAIAALEEAPLVSDALAA